MKFEEKEYILMHHYIVIVLGGYMEFSEWKNGLSKENKQKILSE